MYSGDQFSHLVEKISHPLEEIRCRSLANIHSKLNRGLLPSDKECLSKLVTALLLSLEQNPSFETNCILVILKNLLSNPDTKALIVLSGGLSLFAKMRSSPINGEIRRHIDEICVLFGEDPSVVNTQERLQGNTGRGIQASSYFNSYGSTSLTLTSSDSSQARKVSFNLSAAQGNNNSDAGPSSLSDSSSLIYQNYLLYFPTIALTKTDIGVLRTTLRSVCSKEPNISLSGINFLRDVVLKDFPAEVFLQRTEFIGTLFRILNGKDLELNYATTSCLINFCRGLIRRVYYHLDPNNYKLSNAHTSRPGDSITFGPSETVLFSETDQTGVSFADSTQHNIYTSTSARIKVLDSDEDVKRQSYSTLEFCSQLFSAIASGLLTQLDYHNQHALQNVYSSSQSNTSRNGSWKYKMESNFLLLLDIGINLLLTCLSPHHRTTQMAEVFMTSEPMTQCHLLILYSLLHLPHVISLNPPICHLPSSHPWNY
ncbi:unnamed protein product [Heterobilharzia americana]|nr:unnamed protein product [Heterobilharzia americana]